MLTEPFLMKQDGGNSQKDSAFYACARIKHFCKERLTFVGSTGRGPHEQDVRGCVSIAVLRICSILLV